MTAVSLPIEKLLPMPRFFVDRQPEQKTTVYYLNLLIQEHNKERYENIMGYGENAGFQHFLHNYTTMFSKTLFSGTRGVYQR